jgi:hypothetical protein
MSAWGGTVQITNRGTLRHVANAVFLMLLRHLLMDLGMGWTCNRQEGSEDVTMHDGRLQG